MALAATSTEFVHVTVTSTVAGAAIALASPPQFAFLAGSGNPQSSDWLTAEWSGSHARVLVGPAGGAVTLVQGRYNVWITFAAGVETPVRKAGHLTIY